MTPTPWPFPRHRPYERALQQVVTAIAASNRHPWIAEFRQKYGL